MEWNETILYHTVRTSNPTVLSGFFQIYVANNFIPHSKNKQSNGIKLYFSRYFHSGNETILWYHTARTSDPTTLIFDMKKRKNSFPRQIQRSEQDWQSEHRCSVTTCKKEEKNRYLLFLQKISKVMFVLFTFAVVEKERKSQYN